MYGSIIKQQQQQQYLITFLGLIDSLFKDRHLLISHFGPYAFKVIFSIDQQCNRKLILQKLVGLVCQHHEVTSFHPPTHNNVTTNALLIIEEITKNWSIEVQNLGNLLMVRAFKIRNNNDVHIETFRFTFYD